MQKVAVRFTFAWPCSAYNGASDRILEPEFGGSIFRWHVESRGENYPPHPVH